MTAEYRSDLPARPIRMNKLPLDERGFPVPWFVAWINGAPDFRVIKPNGVHDAHYYQLCWLCGERLGVYKAYVIGPMCGVNRSTSEPACHLGCAMYAVRACPFLTRPLATRDDNALPEGAGTAGIPILRNPGCTLIWITKSAQPFKVKGGSGIMFRLGEPTNLFFYAKGREATRKEVDESVRTGLPILQEYAERDGPKAVQALERMVQVFTELLDKTLPKK